MDVAVFHSGDTDPAIFLTNLVLYFINQFSILSALETIVLGDITENHENFSHSHYPAL